MPFERVLIVGLGAIGGSIVAALHKHSPKTTVYGWDCSAEAMRAVVEGGWISSTHMGCPADNNKVRFEDLADRAELIIIATPLVALEEILQTLKDTPRLLNNTLLTDTMSVKAPVQRVVSELFANHDACFIGGHPLCGSELSGAQAIDADLFVKRYVVLSPCIGDNGKQLALLSTWWQSLGAKVTQCTALEHDQILAYTSHLPHLAVYALMDTLNEVGDSLHLSAGGLRDSTRVAMANPELWADISIANKEHLSHALEVYVERINQCLGFLRTEDKEGLRNLYARAQTLKIKLNALESS